MDPLLRRQREDFHTLQHAAAQSGQLTDDQPVTGLKLIQDLGHLTLPPRDTTRDRFFDKTDVAERSTMSQQQNVGFVFFQVLLSGRDPKIRHGSWDGMRHGSSTTSSNFMKKGSIRLILAEKRLQYQYFSSKNCPRKNLHFFYRCSNTASDAIVSTQQ